jgi:hypothetical protein
MSWSPTELYSLAKLSEERFDKLCDLNVKSTRFTE